MSNIYTIIKEILWGHDPIEVDQDTYALLKQHSIDTLAAPVMNRVVASDTLKNEWMLRIFQQTAYNTRCTYLQKELPITVPYVVLKGTAASQYYSYPMSRTLGDIDVITKREDFETASKELQDNGYQIVKKLDREIGFKKNGVLVELHRYFASLNNPKQAQYLDNMILENIDETHILPDEINGLVLLEHIDQHLENGLGLRQIIDWMMFVDKCLPDEKWQSFRTHANRIGLESLAVVTTRMCEMYLGLQHKEWCSKANEKLCKQLMDYVLACGNFGMSRSQKISTGDNVFYLSNTPKSFFSLLQERGLVNWEAAQKNAVLRPFAWVYQLQRYIIMGLKRDNAYSKIKNEYQSAKQRNKLFKELGVRQASKGLAVYKDGEYKKTK